MNSKEAFHKLFSSLNISKAMDESFAYDMYKAVIKYLNNTGNIDIRYLNPMMILNYIYAEYAYLIGGLDFRSTSNLQNDSAFKEKLSLSICDKIIYNEILTFKSQAYLSKYSPVSTTLNFYLNFIIDRMMKLKPLSEERFVIDMCFKAFSMMKSTLNLLNDGFETEAFSTWRTIHEIESIIAILNRYPEVSEVYARHIEYIKAFRDELTDKNQQNQLFEEMKAKMKEHDLKSKDLKKFIEYGWLYSVKNVAEDYPNMKLNFRNGVETIAGLSSYSKVYEMSSEIAHSSPILIYSNKEYFCEITIISLYETFLRLEEIFTSILEKHREVDSKKYLEMRSIYLETLQQILYKEKILFFNSKKNDDNKN